MGNQGIILLLAMPTLYDTVTTVSGSSSTTESFSSESDDMLAPISGALVTLAKSFTSPHVPQLANNAGKEVLYELLNALFINEDGVLV